MKRLLVRLVLVFCSGIIAAAMGGVGFFCAYSGSAVFFIFSLFSVKRRGIFLLFLYCAVFLFAMAFYIYSTLKPGNAVDSFIPTFKNRGSKAADEVGIPPKKGWTSGTTGFTGGSIKVKGVDSCGVKGYIDNEPAISTGETVFILNTREILFNDLWHSCSGKILVRLRGQAVFRHAEELILLGNIHLVSGKVNSTGKNYGDFLSGRGIWAVMNVKTPDHVVCLKREKFFSVKGLSFLLKEHIERVIHQYLAPIPAGIIDAMVLGEKKNVSRFINDSMMKSGTVHILVVSGFNVGIVCFMIVICLKLIRIPRKPRLLIACLMLIVYCVMTASSTPVMRATIMAIVYLCSYFVRRQPDIYNSLCFSALIILIINPRQLFDIGFQLSFVSVFSIVYLYPRIKAFLKVESLKPGILRFFVEGGIVSICAWLGTAGFIAYYFKIISPITVIANIFIVPLASLLTLCGISLIIMGFVCPTLAGVFSHSVELLVFLLLRINNCLIQAPGAYFYLP